MFFAGVQMPGRAKLVLVKGDANDGVAYQLNGTEHVLGRMEGAILFPEDPLISPRHANFVYRDSKLYKVHVKVGSAPTERAAQPKALPTKAPKSTVPPKSALP